MFSYEYCEILKSTVFEEHLRMTLAIEYFSVSQRSVANLQKRYRNDIHGFVPGPEVNLEYIVALHVLSSF